MISDKELELLDKKPLLGAAVTGPAVRLGRTQTANPATLAVFADGLTGGTATTVTVETAVDEAFTSAETVATFPTGISDGLILQAAIPFGCKEFIRLKVTPTGTFTAGTLSARVGWGAELSA